jgi:hypothetical protein
MLDGGFTCCTGSSMESHALHGDGIYHEDGDSLWISLYAPSTAEWREAGVKVTVDTGFPIGDSATISVATAAPREFSMRLRRPSWVVDFGVEVNGRPVEVPAVVSSQSDFVEILREWRDGDRVVVALPKSLRLEPLVDNPGRAAVLWGPLVLAADLGAEDSPAVRGLEDGRIEGVPVFVAGGLEPGEWLKPVGGQPGRFRTEGVGRPRDAEFVPFYQLHRRLYAAYVDLYTPEGYEAHAAELAEAAARASMLAAATVGFVQPGEMQPERDFNMQGEETTPVRLQGRAGRRAAGWFSFDLPVVSGEDLTLVVTYNRDEWRDRSFEILLDGEKLSIEKIPRRGPVEFYDREYALPRARTEGKTKVTVRFQSTDGLETAAVYGVRVVRAQAILGTEKP